jgi:predicted kinase
MTVEMFRADDNQRQEMLILVGLQGSGKTTFASKLLEAEPNRWVRVNWDELRKAHPKWTPGKFVKEVEKEVQESSFKAVREALKAGKSVIIDNTNINFKTRTKWELLASELEIPIVIKHMTASLAECIERDAQRTGYSRCGRAVIERTALFADRIPFDPAKKLVIVDMDGTLSDCAHRRHFVHPENGNKKDWNGFYAHCAEDPAVPAIKTWVTALGNDPDFIVCITSGRPIDKAGDQTIAWLAQHEIPYDHLFMRNSGDKRPDYEVKQDILNHLPKDQIAFCIDDRNQVCEMLRRNGLTVYQVADGNF